MRMYIYTYIYSSGLRVQREEVGRDARQPAPHPLHPLQVPVECCGANGGQ